MSLGLCTDRGIVSFPTGDLKACLDNMKLDKKIGFNDKVIKKYICYINLDNIHLLILYLNQYNIKFINLNGITILYDKNFSNSIVVNYLNKPWSITDFFHYELGSPKFISLIDLKMLLYDDNFGSEIGTLNINTKNIFARVATTNTFVPSGDIIISVNVKNPHDLDKYAPLLSNLLINGKLACKGVNLLSDISLKKNILSLQIPSILDKLTLLNPVKFTWINETYEDIGLIAQEVYNIFPDACSINNYGCISVDYSKLLLYFILAFKELHKK